MRWSAVALEDLLAEREAQGRPWLEFLRVPTLSTGLYVIPAGGVDNQTAHRRDEVYFIISGKAMLFVDGERRPSKAGDVIFVKRGIDHRFEDIEEDLQVLVFFAGAGAEEE
jgi:mannose-6-phosphate isomerase-like protein (cupin superfamily)